MIFVTFSLFFPPIISIFSILSTDRLGGYFEHDDDVELRHQLGTNDDFNRRDFDLSWLCLRRISTTQCPGPCFARPLPQPTSPTAEQHPPQQQFQQSNDPDRDQHTNEQQQKHGQSIQPASRWS